MHGTEHFFPQFAALGEVLSTDEVRGVVCYNDGDAAKLCGHAAVICQWQIPLLQQTTRRNNAQSHNDTGLYQTGFQLYHGDGATDFFIVGGAIALIVCFLLFDTDSFYPVGKYKQLALEAEAREKEKQAAKTVAKTVAETEQTTEQITEQTAEQTQETQEEREE